MPNIDLRAVASAIVIQALGFLPSVAQADTPPYPVMSPLAQYLIGDETAEAALARSAAPASISTDADVMVLRQDGFATVAKGSNGFVCLVERSWAKPTDDAEFWNPRIRAPNCFNQAASKTFLPIFLMKTKLAIAGKSPSQILAATDAAFRKKELPALAPGAMCYMLANQQYLSDEDKGWHPHVMFFVSGDVAKTWGANLKGSPLMAGNDPEERVTIFMMLSNKWSDGAASVPASQGH